MNILITGGLGYIGSHTCLSLVKKGHNIVAIDNLSNSSIVVLEKLNKLSKTSIDFVQGSVLNLDILTKTLRDYEIDSVIHFAGLKSVPLSIKSPLSYYQNNVYGTLTLLKAMTSLNIKKLVFSSSATIYGEPEYLPYDENHRLNPLSTYAKTKFMIEEILGDLCRSDKEWRAISLRYFNPSGAHETGLIGESPKDLSTNIMPHLLKVASGDLPYLKVFGDDYNTPDGTGIRDYIHVMDLADAHSMAVNFLNKMENYHEIFNLGIGKGVSVMELIKTFEKVNQVSIAFKIEKRREGDIDEFYADNSKSIKVLGWTPKRNLDDMCKSAWVFQRKSEKNKSA